MDCDDSLLGATVKAEVTIDATILAPLGPFWKHLAG
jgi:hypothetical protein